MCDEKGCQCGRARGACATEFQYAVKVVCGEVLAKSGVSTPVAPGRYWTAINVHNPDKCKPAHFRWKVTVANQIEPGPVSPYQRPIVLDPDRAIEIDCPQILPAVPQQPPLTFVKGYVVIESDVELDVVAVYSGSTGACSSNTFHTERVQPRCVPVCEDLILPLNTGLADWQTVAPTAGALGPVVAINPSAFAPPPFGSVWVSQTSTDGGGAAVAIRYYQLCFDLCFGYDVPKQFQIQLIVDDIAEVFMNNQQVGGIIPYNTQTALSIPPNLLHAGRNCLRVQVNNLHGSTGFALVGNLYVPRGKCPCSPLPIAAPRGGPAVTLDISSQAEIGIAEELG